MDSNNNPSQIQMNNPDPAFLNWSIPTYFIENYQTDLFHAQCSQQTDRNSPEHFIRHLQDYLHSWSGFRGKWIQQFIVGELGGLGGFEEKMGEGFGKGKGSRFGGLLAELKFDHKYFLLTQFISKFYHTCIHQAQNPQQTPQLQSLSTLYFKYRLEISLNPPTEQDLGRPTQIITFIKYLKAKAQTEQKGKEIIELLRSVAYECGFEDLYQEIVSGGGDFEGWDGSFMRAGGIDGREMGWGGEIMGRQKEQSAEGKIHFNNATTSTSHPNKNIEQQTSEAIKIQQPDRQSRGKAPKKLLQKLKKSSQKTQKITKTTRTSNFKGTFIKKTLPSPSPPTFIHISHQQSTEIIYGRHQNQKYKEKQIYKEKYKEKIKINSKIEPESYDHFDFLCDRSF